MDDNAVPVEPELPAGASGSPHCSRAHHTFTPDFCKPNLSIKARNCNVLFLAVLDPHKIERVVDVINPRVTK
jgi:hypothetical protein